MATLSSPKQEAKKRRPSPNECNRYSWFRQGGACAFLFSTCRRFIVESCARPTRRESELDFFVFISTAIAAHRPSPPSPPTSFTRVVRSGRWRIFSPVGRCCSRGPQQPPRVAVVRLLSALSSCRVRFAERITRRAAKSRRCQRATPCPTPDASSETFVDVRHTRGSRARLLSRRFAREWHDSFWRRSLSAALSGQGGGCLCSANWVEAGPSSGPGSFPRTGPWKRETVAVRSWTCVLRGLSVFGVSRSPVGSLVDRCFPYTL